METISVSRLRLYMECHRKYYLKYRKGIQAGTLNQQALDIGSAVHLALEEGMALWHKTNDRDQGYHRAVTCLEELAPESIRERAIEVINNHARKVFYESNIEAVYSIDGKPALEVQLDTTLDGIPFTGRIDAIIVNTAGELVMIDWKTRASFYPAESVHLDSQLYIYAYALLQQYGIRVSSLVLCELSTKDSNIAFHKLDTSLVDYHAQAFIRNATQLLSDNEFAGIHNAYQCKSCDYLAACYNLIKS